MNALSTLDGFGALLAAELRRFVSRRLFKGLGIAIVAIVLLQAGVQFFQSSADPASGLEEARRQVELCEREREAAGARDEPTELWECGSPEDYRGFYDRRFAYARTIADAFQGLGVMFLALGLLVGGSFVGAEWGTGSMTTLLTWQPRRGVVLAAKVVAAAIVVAAALAALLLLIAAIFYPVGALRGTTQGAGASFWWTRSGIGLRSVGLGVFGVVVGTSLATLLRGTAGAVGVGLFYGTIADGLLGLWRRGLLREWLIQYNVQRLLGMEVPVGGDEPFFGQQAVLSATRPALLLTIYGLALLAVAYAVFRRRDVT